MFLGFGITRGLAPILDTLANQGIIGAQKETSCDHSKYLFGNFYHTSLKTFLTLEKKSRVNQCAQFWRKTRVRFSRNF